MPTDPSDDERTSLRSKVLRALERSPYEPYTGSDERRVSEPYEGDEPGFSGKQAAEIIDVSYRQLDYWTRTDLIRPSIDPPGGRRRYSYRDLIELKLVKTLLDAGVKLETIRDAFRYIRDELGEDLSSAKLVLAGHSAVLVQEDELVEVFSRYKGKGVLNFVDLDDIKNEVDAAIVETDAS